MKSHLCPPLLCIDDVSIWKLFYELAALVFFYFKTSLFLASIYYIGIGIGIDDA